MALLRWEPRITLDSIRYQPGFDGSMEVALSGTRNQSTFSLSIPVS